nr:BA14K family protein [uncultured Gellertiella sp.]
MRSSIASIGSALLAVLMLATSVPAEAASMPTASAVQTGSDVVTVGDPGRFRAEENQQWRRHRGWRNGDMYYNGHRGYREFRPGYRRYNGFWFPGAAFATGIIIGGALAERPVMRRGIGSSHVHACMNRYRSYRAWDDTYQPNYGPRRRCGY